MNLSQIAGIVRYEIRMALRRRVPIILFLLMLCGLIAFTLISRDSMERSGIFTMVQQGESVTFGELAPEEAASVPPQLRDIDLLTFSTSSSVFTALMATIIIGVIGVVFFTGETIPIDRQYKVRELLDTTPMSHASYLAGKLLSVWLTLLVIGVLVAAIGLVVASVLLTGYDVRLYLALWIVFGLPMLLIASAQAVLLTSWAGSRRAAILLAMLVMPIAVIVVAIGLVSLGGVGALIDPAYGYFLLTPINLDAAALTRERIADALPILIAALILPWLLAWGWTRMREAR